MKKVISVAFISVIASVLILSVALPDKAVSEQENRTLMTKDGISLNIKDGEFQKDYQEYLSDQFPLRESLVAFQSRLRLLAGQKCINGAYVCNGRLIQRITDSEVKSSALLAYADRVNALAKSKTVYVMYVPSAGVSLSGLLPRGAPMYDYKGLYSELTQRVNNAKVVDLTACLNNGNCYFKTDHHWNSYGAYCAYIEFCKARNVEPKSFDSFELESVCNDFRGTLYSKAPVSKEEDEILLPAVSGVTVTADGNATDFYVMSALETKDKYNVYQGGNHGIVEITNPDGNGKTLLVLKDSFANSFVPFFAKEYSKIVMLDERYTFISLEDYVVQLNPDEILVLKEIIN